MRYYYYMRFQIDRNQWNGYVPGYNIRHTGLSLSLSICLHQNRTRSPRWGADVQLYSSFNLGARQGWVVTATPRPLHPRERPGTHCIGGWVGLRAGLDGYGKFRPNQESIPGPSSPQQVATPTALTLCLSPYIYIYICTYIIYTILNVKDQLRNQG